MKESIFIPDGKNETEALSRTTHLAIAAHQDDIEIMAYDGILKCFAREDKWFTGVVVTNGSGSPRSGLYADCSDEDMMKIRRTEQEKAAYVGEYAAQLFFDLPSSAVKNPNQDSVDKIAELILKTKPEIIYTHNLADKHETHVGVAVKTIQALRQIDYAPPKVYGCEVWRSLDWMLDSDKIKFDVQGHSNLENALLGVFDSQICGGKRYDLATAGRRLANATYAESHGVDDTSALMYAMDLTPLIKDKGMDIGDYVQGYINALSDSVAGVLKSLL